MFVPIWMIAAAGTVLVVLLALLFTRGRGTGRDDMLSRQRAATPPPPPPRQVPPSDEAALMALPEVAEAMRKGNKIEAIKIVRGASGLGLREAKELVERNS